MRSEPDGHRVGGGLEREPAVGTAQDGPCDRAALGLVGVEQALARFTSGDEGELPAQVDSITDGEVHALPARRAVDMGGVADEEDVPDPKSLGDPAVDPEQGSPDDAPDRGVNGEVVIEPPLEVGAGHLGVRLVRNALTGTRRGEARRDGTEEPVATIAQPEDTHEPAGGQMQAQSAGREGSVVANGELHIGEQTGLVVCTARETDAESGPDGAARAVRPHNSPGRDGLLDPTEAAHDPAVRSAGQGDELGVPLDRPTELVQPVDQHLLGTVLPEPEREPERCERLGSSPRQRELRHPPGPLEDLDARRTHPLRDGPVGQPQPIQQLQGPHMHDGRPRLPDRPGLAVHDPHRHALLGEHHSQSQPARAGADDQHIGRHDGHHLVPWL